MSPPLCSYRDIDGTSHLIKTDGNFWLMSRQGQLFILFLVGTSQSDNSEWVNIRSFSTHTSRMATSTMIGNMSLPWDKMLKKVYGRTLWHDMVGGGCTRVERQDSRIAGKFFLGYSSLILF